MFKFLSKLRSRWYRLSEVPDRGFFSPDVAGYVGTPEEALSLSPFYAGLRLYSSTLASLPLVTYRRLPDGGRERNRSNSAYVLLHDKPNPAQTRSTFFELCARSLFLEGEFFALIQWAGNGRVLNLFPLPVCQVQEVIVDDEWNKAYVIRNDNNEVEVVPDADMIHVLMNSKDGVRGTSLLKYAAESLGLHKQVQSSANTYYKNAAKPSGYLKYAGRLNPETVNEIRLNFKSKYQGAENAGEIPLIQEGGEFNPLPTTAAVDAQIIEALGTSVADVARWFGVSPLLLGDLSRGTYSNLSSDNIAFYQRSLRPVLDKIELEFNNKLFGPDADVYCEFLLSNILRGSPQEEQAVLNGYIQSGVMTRQEVREILNLPPIDGLDTPLAPLNQGASSVVNQTPLPPPQPQQEMMLSVNS